MKKTERVELTEIEAIERLEELAEKWPRGLWLFSASGSLHVMRYRPNGHPAMTRAGGYDDGWAVREIDIPNDGGDW